MATRDKLPNDAQSQVHFAMNGDSFLDLDADQQAALVMSDFAAAYRLLESGELDGHGGDFAAVLDGKLVGTGKDSVDLRMKVSKEQHVHPERIAVIHIVDEIRL